MSPMQPQDIMREIMATAKEMSALEVYESLTIVRRTLEMTAPLLPNQYKLANLMLSLLMESVRQQCMGHKG